VNSYEQREQNKGNASQQFQSLPDRATASHNYRARGRPCPLYAAEGPLEQMQRYKALVRQRLRRDSFKSITLHTHRNAPSH